jgi:Flp pilus assembly protein TadB
MVAMSVVVLAALAAGTALGLLLVAAGLSGRAVLTPASEGRAARVLRGTGLARVGGSAAAFLVVVGVTGWIVGGVLAAVACVALPRVLGGKASRQRAIDRTEAVASWTEMVRDSIVAASGLEEAIVATAPVAPPPISREVRGLVRRIDHQRLPDALVAFGSDLDHPSGDLVVAALVTASRLEASDLSGLLTRLADATRDEARMRIRVEVGRTRVRTATKVIVGVVVVAVAFLAVVNRDYLAVYDSPTGQLVLAVVGGIFATGGWLLARMSEIGLPERFTARAGGPSTDWVER